MKEKWKNASILLITGFVAACIIGISFSDSDSSSSNSGSKVINSSWDASV